MLFRRKKELQSLLEATRKSLGMAENKAEKLAKQAKELHEENHALYEENKELRKMNAEMESRISDLEVQCEFLFNNLSKKKRELVDNGKAN